MQSARSGANRYASATPRAGTSFSYLFLSLTVNRHSLRTYPNKDTFAYLIMLLGPSNLGKNDHFLGDESPSLLKKAHHFIERHNTSPFQFFFNSLKIEYSLDERD